jgi:predicted permease
VFDTTRQDVRYAARALGQSPLFTLTALLSLAIGIGAITAIVTVANTLLLRPPPGVGDPERVVHIGRTQDGSGFDNFSYPNFRDYRAGATSLAGIAAIQMDPRSLSLAGPDGGEAVQGSIVSGNLFDVLLAKPAVGRFFLPEEDRVPGASAVVVLSHRFWRERFASDPGIVGRTIVLNGSRFTVVGVAARGFQGPIVLVPDLWAPVMASPLLGTSEELLDSRGSVWLMAVGRLAPDVPLSAAQAELSTIAHRLEQTYPEANRSKGVRVLPSSVFPGELRNIVRGFMALLLAVAGLVLLIASTNVAGMLLARAASRQREIAVRLALGATRARLMRQLVTESLMLFVAAGAAGVFLAHWLVVGLMMLVPRLPMQLGFDPAIDWRVLTFTIAVSLGSGLLAGLVPALQATRPELTPALKSEGGGSGRRLRLRSGLLVAQISFSMLLLITAGLFGRALMHARGIDAGFDPRDVHLASMDLGLVNYDEVRGMQFASSLLERARAVPGVRTAALSAMLPLGGSGLGLGGLRLPDAPADDERSSWRADWNVITPGYFETLRLPIVRGRDFSDADREGATPAVIINETFARRLWPDEEPLGKTIRNGEIMLTVVGVARDAKYRSLGEEPRNFVYVPLAQRWFSRTSLLVRTEGDVAVAAPIRRIVAELEPALPILDQRSMVEHAATSLFPQRVALWVAGSLGTVALLLALLGIYGVTAYGVVQRSREIGIRVALGAQRGNVLRLILRQGLLLAGLGVALGAVAAFGVTRLLRALLYGVPPTDLASFGGAAGVLLAAALAASWIPARRAAAVDPVIALRAD